MQKVTEVRDEVLFPQRPDYLFDPEGWPQRIGDANEGRGGTVMVANDTGRFALRQYRRGGLVARLLADQYLYTGAENTRCMREWRLLLEMTRIGLPVPVPAAARFIQSGLFYRASLVTRWIPDSETLAQRLTQRPLMSQHWHKLGGVIATFHQHGIYHADLNAHNVMLDAESNWFLIDFDRGEQRERGKWQLTNLGRLHRSLEKERGRMQATHWDRADWSALLEGYAAVSDSVR
ncbi:MAG: 3-deoxy-D-manno-octulosonic acid kinase [Pseudomonadota bacterium]